MGDRRVSAGAALHPISCHESGDRVIWRAQWVVAVDRNIISAWILRGPADQFNVSQPL